MKKFCFLLIVLFSALSFNAFSQSDTTDFYAGKWEITIFGTPNGDAKMFANISRKEGKLVGDMTNPAEPNSAPIPMSKIEEADGKVIIYFSAGGYDLNIPFEKVDGDNLIGKLMEMFETKAKRVL